MIDQMQTHPDGPEATDVRGARRAALIAFAAALFVRVAYVGLVSRSPFYDVRQMAGTDNFTFFEWAGRIAAGDLIGSGEFYLPPLYPYLLALMLKLSGSQFARFFCPDRSALGHVFSVVGCISSAI